MVYVVFLVKEKKNAMSASEELVNVVHHSFIEMQRTLNRYRFHTTKVNV